MSRVFQYVRERRRRQTGVTRYKGHAPHHIDVEAVRVACRFHLADGRLDDLGWLHPFPSAATARSRARHVHDVLKQAVEPIELGPHDLGLLLPFNGRQRRCIQIVRGNGDGGERCLQRMTEGFQQGRLQRGAAAKDLRFPDLRRQVARENAHGKKREQLRDALRVRDSQRADRRQKEEVETERRRDGGEYGDPTS